MKCGWNCLRRGALQVLIAVATVAAANPAQAHDPRPVTVTVEEGLDDIFRYNVRVPPVVYRDNQPVLVWPEKCESLPPAATMSLRVMRCPGGIEGEILELRYPMFNPSLATFYQLSDRDGTTLTAMLPPSEQGWTVPARPERARVALRYLLLGVEHILGGPDHLLFVLGLLVIAGTTRRILWTITGFTLAHSLTLSLSALDLIDVPIVPVEAGIALSILYLAVEIGQRKHDTLTYRYPLIVSFAFGLLHGLGFASALGEIGLPRGEVLVSLLFFNLGVEVGQLIFIAAVVTFALALRKAAAAGAAAWPARKFEGIAMYLIGIPSAYWLIDRLSFLA